MPLHDLLENALSTRLDHITVARDQTLKVPAVDLCDRFVEASSVTRRESVPEHALLPDRAASGVLDAAEELRQQAGRRRQLGLAHLFRSGQVEQQIRFDQSLRWLVAEHELLVGVRINVFHVELPVELLGDRVGFAFGEEESKVDLWVALLVSVIGQGIRSDDHRRRVLLLPWLDEDVVLLIQRSDVFDLSKLFHRRSHLVGQCDWAEHCKRARFEAYDGTATTNLDAAKAKEGNG